MPSNKVERDQRAALAGPDDRVRGVFFNVILDLVSHHVGPIGMAQVRTAAALDAKISDFRSYPARTFVNLLYAAADGLEAKLGYEDKAFHACGQATVNKFASSGAGAVVFGVLARGDPRKLFATAAKSYGTAVNYGSRVYLPITEKSCKLVFRGDMLPPTYQQGVLGGALKALGFQGTVDAAPVALDHCEYTIRWK